MSRSIVLRKAKKNKDGDIKITVLGETFNFTIYGGIGTLLINQKLRKMIVTDELKMWFKIANETRGEL